MRQANPIEGETKEEKIEYLNSLPYSVMLKQKADSFYAIIPELCLVGVSDNLEEAYEELGKQKQEIFTRLTDCEAEDQIVLPRKTEAKRDTFHQIKMFIYKLIIVCVICGFTLITSGALITNKIAGISVADILKMQIRSVVSNAELSLVYATEDRKQERLKKLRLYIEELRPLIQEIQMLFTPQVNDREQNIKEDSSG